MNGDRQAKALDRIRAKGLALAPQVVDGRIVRSKAENKTPAARAALGAPVADLSPQRPITRTRGVDRLEGRTAPQPGQVFELLIPAPAEFLNANRDKSLHWAEKGRRVASWRHEGLRSAGFADLPKGLPRVRIDAYVRKPIANRFDPANWAPTAKAVVDGLVTDYGLCEDDNRHFVEGPFMHDGGKGEPALRVVVTVLEVMAA